MIVMSRGGQWPNVGHMESQLSTQQLYLTYVKHKPGSRMIVLVIIVLSPFLSLKTVLLEIYFMN